MDIRKALPDITYDIGLLHQARRRRGPRDKSRNIRENFAPEREGPKHEPDSSRHL